MSYTRTSKTSTTEKAHASPPVDTMANSTGEPSTSKQIQKRDSASPAKLGNVDTGKNWLDFE